MLPVRYNSAVVQKSPFDPVLTVSQQREHHDGSVSSIGTM